MILIGFILSFITLIYTVLNGYFMGYGLFISFLIFAFISYKQGISIDDIKANAWTGGKRAFVVLKVFILIGLVTASWLIAGTIPAIVYYSLEVMNPSFFILFAFLASSAVSYMLGTSFGTVSTIGVVLIIMAKGGDINLNLAAGAILSGIYFGDRSSPMSSSANLLANQTDTELYSMLKGLRRTGFVPFIITSLIYLLLSFSNPLTIVGTKISSDLHNNFTINFIVLLPAIIMMVLSAFQYNVRKAMFLSVIAGSIIAIVLQGESMLNLIKTLVFGYKLDPSNPLANLLKGGGLISMLKSGLVVFISCAMAGLLEGLSLFEKTSQLFSRFNTRSQLLVSTGITSMATAAFGGNQSIAIVMTSQIMKGVYMDKDMDEFKLANDISITATLFAAMIPWNIAVFVPAVTLDVSAVRIIPYAFFLFIPFIYNYFIKYLINKIFTSL